MTKHKIVNSEVLTSGGGHATPPADGGADVSEQEDTTARDVDGAKPAVLFRPVSYLPRLWPAQAEQVCVATASNVKMQLSHWTSSLIVRAACLPERRKDRIDCHLAWHASPSWSASHGHVSMLVVRRSPAGEAGWQAGTLSIGMACIQSIGMV